MESKNYISESSDYRKAILRAYKDEPLIRYVAFTEEGSVMVKSETAYLEWKEGRGRNSWIGWPLEDVFEFIPDLYKQLVALNQKGKASELKTKWHNAKRLIQEL